MLTGPPLTLGMMPHPSPCEAHGAVATTARLAPTRSLPALRGWDGQVPPEVAWRNAWLGQRLPWSNLPGSAVPCAHPPVLPNSFSGPTLKTEGESE